MKIDERIKELLGRYILKYVDQLSEGVVEWYDTDMVVGSDESGYWVSHEITVAYRVHVDVDRRGYRHWRWDVSPTTMIGELVRMEEED